MELGRLHAAGQILLVVMLLVVGAVLFSITTHLLGVSSLCLDQQAIWVGVFVAIWFAKNSIGEITFGTSRKYASQAFTGLLAGLGSSTLYILLAYSMQAYGMPTPYSPIVAGYVKQGFASFTLFMIFVVWFSAAIGEEWLFRGFIFNRLEFVFLGIRWNWLIASAIQASIFGFVHFSAGISSVVLATLLGFIFSITYLSTGRSLIAPTFAHGVTNSVIITTLVFKDIAG